MYAYNRIICYNFSSKKFRRVRHDTKIIFKHDVMFLRRNDKNINRQKSRNDF